MKVDTPVDLSGTFAGDLHGVLRAAASQGPLATDILTGATVVLRQGDLETLAHDQRLPGIGLTLFDMMGIADGPLRDWYGALMFTTEGDYHRRIRSLVSRAFTPRSVEALRATAADMAATAVASVRHGGDLVAACSALATRLICRLLGRTGLRCRGIQAMGRGFESGVLRHDARTSRRRDAGDHGAANLCRRVDAHVARRTREAISSPHCVPPRQTVSA